MFAQLLVLAVLPLLLLAAAFCDLTRYTIPNRLCAALVLAFALFAVVLPLPLNALGLHVAAGAAALALGFGLFALGWIGGGDAKLFAAIALWLGFADLTEYAVAVALFGGALSLSLLMLRQVPLPAPLLGQGWLLKLHDRQSGIPYGVALAAAAFAVLPHAAIFRLAAQG